MNTRDAIAAIRSDERVRAVVLGSTDLRSAPAATSGCSRNSSGGSPRKSPPNGTFYRADLTGLALDVPAIAAIEGDAIGAGLTLTLSYDIRIASESARLGFTF